MQTRNYWKQFENTGRIEDYLSYKEQDCAGNRTENSAENSFRDGAGNRTEDSAQDSKETSAAGAYRMPEGQDREADGGACRNSYR